MTTRNIIVVNPNDRSFTRNRYLLWFGQFSPTFLLVYANSLEAALDEAVDEYLSEHEPASVVDHEEQKELLEEAAAEHGEDYEFVTEEAFADLTPAGGHGEYIVSYEWGIVAENPTKEQLIEFHRGV